MSKGEYVIVPKGTKFRGAGKLGLIILMHENTQYFLIFPVFETLWGTVAPAPPPSHVIAPWWMHLWNARIESSSPLHNNDTEYVPVV